MRLVAGLRAAILGTVLVFGAVACGGDDEDPAIGSSIGPDGGQVSAEEVSAGLRVITELAHEAVFAIGTDADAARAAHGEIEPTWEPVRSTVEANDQAAYLSFEDSFDLLGGAIDRSDATAGRAASDTIAAAAEAYLARFPADGSRPFPTASPLPSPGPTVAAGTAGPDPSAGPAGTAVPSQTPAG